MRQQHNPTINNRLTRTRTRVTTRFRLQHINHVTSTSFQRLSFMIFKLSITMRRINVLSRIIRISSTSILSHQVQLRHQETRVRIQRTIINTRRARRNTGQDNAFQIVSTTVLIRQVPTANTMILRHRGTPQQRQRSLTGGHLSPQRTQEATNRRRRITQMVQRRFARHTRSLNSISLIIRRHNIRLLRIRTSRHFVRIRHTLTASVTTRYNISMVRRNLTSNIITRRLTVALQHRFLQLLQIMVFMNLRRHRTRQQGRLRIRLLTRSRILNTSKLITTRTQRR